MRPINIASGVSRDAGADVEIMFKLAPDHITHTEWVSDIAWRQPTMYKGLLTAKSNIFM